MFQAEIETTGAGRTDTGVHARGQVLSFSAESQLPPEKVRRAVSGLLGPEIVARACALVAPDFDARFSARWRAYRYRVLTTELPDPLMRHTSWHVPGPLSLEAMNQAAAAVVGEHDFASFCRGAQGKTTVRTVLAASWSAQGELAVFAIRAAAFCHQMVRSLTGFCVDAGRGRVDPASVAVVLAARDRAAARPIAPPQGLVLWEVGY